MINGQDDELSKLLRRFPLTPAERRAFLDTSIDASLVKVRVLTVAAIYFNAASVTEFGGRPGPTRGVHLIEQVIGAAFQTFAGVDPHPTPFDKAPMLMRGITGGHPFQDGNKRTGFLVAAYYLDVTGYPAPAALSISETVMLSRRVSAGELREVDVIARELRRLWTEPG